MNEKVLIDGLKKLSRDIADVVTALEEPDAVPAAEPKKEKRYTYEEVRGILAEKARTGFRTEVKAILTAHGVKQLSDVKEQEVFAAIAAEAEEIGNG